MLREGLVDDVVISILVIKSFGGHYVASLTVNNSEVK